MYKKNRYLHGSRSRAKTVTYIAVECIQKSLFTRQPFKSQIGYLMAAGCIHRLLFTRQPFKSQLGYIHCCRVYIHEIFIYTAAVNPHSTGRRFRYAHGDHGVSLKLFQIAAEAYTVTRFGDFTLLVRFHYASVTLRLRCCRAAHDSVALSLRFCYDPATTMKIRLRLEYANGVAATRLLRHRRRRYAFVALLSHFYIKSEV